MTPEQIKKLVIKPIDQLATISGIPNGKIPFYDGSAELKLMDAANFNNLSKTAMPLSPTDPTPTVEGLYIPTVSGTYTNAGGLVAQEGFYTLFFFDGTNWTKSETKNSVKITIWSDQDYSPNDQVIKDNLIYVTPNGATATDIPGESDKWIELSGTKNEFSFNLNSSILNSIGVSLDYMVSAKPAPFSGYLQTIELISDAAGTAKFALMKRYTYNNSPEVAGGKDSFGEIREFEIENIQIGRHTYDVTEKGIYMREDENLAMKLGGDVKPQIVDSTDFGWWQSDSSALLTYQPGDVGFTFSLFSEKFEPKKQPINRIVVKKNLLNYNSIRNIINAITDASENNQYEVFVPNGVYREFDLQGKKYVKVIGESLEGVKCTIDTNDGSLTSPSDYAYSAYANTALNAIPREYCHLLFIKNDAYFENIHFDITRGKYTAHIDNDGFENLGFYNCRFTEVDTNYTLGMGIWSGQKIVFDKCYVERSVTTGQRLGFVIHNATAQSLPAKVIFENTKFKSCGYGLVSELGSNQDDSITFINCESDGVGAIEMMVEESTPGHSVWVNPSTGTTTTNPTEVPYNLKVIGINTNIDLIKERPVNFTGYNEARPEYYKYYEVDYIKKAGVFPPVTKGSILSIPITGLNNYCFNSNPFSNSLTDGKIIGVALNDSEFGIVYYAPIGKIAKTKVTGSIGAGANQRLIFDNGGNLVSSPTSINPDAISYDTDLIDGMANVKIL